MFEDCLIETVGRLVQFPRLGRAVPEIEDEAIREVIYRGHRIAYTRFRRKCRRTNDIPFHHSSLGRSRTPGWRRPDGAHAV